MDLDEIKGLIAAMTASDLAEMTFSEHGWTLRLVREHRGAPEAAPAQTPKSQSRTVDAPVGGVVHLQPEPGAAAFVRAGQSVRAGEALCLIEAMKVFNTIHAEHDGVIAAVLVASGVEVDAGQALMRLA